MTDDEIKEPLMPLLTALRKRKLQVQLLGESAVVTRRDGTGAGVEAYDLVRQYATGQTPLAAVVDQIAARLGNR